MTEHPVDSSPDDPGETPPAAAPRPLERRFRRTMVSTGFSDVPGKTCEICGFHGFRWQTECPQGHPLS